MCLFDREDELQCRMGPYRRSRTEVGRFLAWGIYLFEFARALVSTKPDLGAKSWRSQWLLSSVSHEPYVAASDTFTSESQVRGLISNLEKVDWEKYSCGSEATSKWKSGQWGLSERGTAGELPWLNMGSTGSQCTFCPPVVWSLLLQKGQIQSQEVLCGAFYFNLIFTTQTTESTLDLNFRVIQEKVLCNFEGQLLFERRSAMLLC